MSFTRFLTQFTIFLIIIAAFAAYPLYRDASAETLRALVYSFIFFYILTSAIFLFITYKPKDSNTISKKYLASVGIKLLIGLVYYVILLKEFKGNEVPFTICFFVAYLVCTGFEIWYLMKNIAKP